MSELDRDMDSSRFDTEPLQFISREGLTCQEIESYFTESIDEGKSHEDDDIFSTVSHADLAKKAKVNNTKQDVNVGEDSNGSFKDKPLMAPGIHVKQPEKSSIDKTFQAESAPSTPRKMVTISENISKHGKGVYESFQDFPSTNEEGSSFLAKKVLTIPAVELQKETTDAVASTVEAVDGDPLESVNKSEERFDRMARILARQYMWTSIAVASFVLGIGCLVLSRSVQPINFHRRYSRR